MNFLASPPLVVAYALAGTLQADLLRDPLGTGPDGQPVYLRDVWPDEREIDEVVRVCLEADMFAKDHAGVYAGDERWQTMAVPAGTTFAWDHTSTYDASVDHAAAGTPLVVLAGKEYGSGSSRDWAAKGTALLGVRAVIAESYERIHRSNLIGMGVLPLQSPEGHNAGSLGLAGEETLEIAGIDDFNEGDIPATVTACPEPPTSQCAAAVSGVTAPSCTSSTSTGRAAHRGGLPHRASGV